MKRYDLIVVGAGPSGLSAAIEAAKKGMRDYRTGLYCVTKCCKARNYRLF